VDGLDAGRQVLVVKLVSGVSFREQGRDSLQCLALHLHPAACSPCGDGAKQSTLLT
jgi:hypothetical protein